MKMDNSGHNKEEIIRKIITAEFDKEVFERQKQLEQYESEMARCQKLLHLTRYAAVKSYYCRKELEYNQAEEEENLKINDLIEQKRLHPALKKIIGENSVILSAQRSKRKNVNSTTSTNSVSLDSIKKENEDPYLSESTDTITGEPSKNSTLTTSHPSLQTERSKFKTEPLRSRLNSGNMGYLNDFNLKLGPRKKVKRTIVIGNISQWMPTYDEESGFGKRESNFTHKWMVYVRGPKESPEISHFVEKVIFFLHPSFKPHDVLEISKPPFHLKKVGWGEFPLRLQIHFTNSLNKPVDIIHQLKLPLQHPGKQVLGNETVVEIQLHEDINIINKILSEENEQSPKKLKTDQEVKEQIGNVNEDIPEEDICIGVQTDDLLSMSFDQEFLCFNESINEIIQETEIDGVIYESDHFENSLTDHSYSLPFTTEYINHETTATEEGSANNTCEVENNNFIYGLGDHYVNDSSSVL